MTSPDFRVMLVITVLLLIKSGRSVDLKNDGTNTESAKSALFDKKATDAGDTFHGFNGIEVNPIPSPVSVGRPTEEAVSASKPLDMVMHAAYNMKHTTKAETIPDKGGVVHISFPNPAVVKRHRKKMLSKTPGGRSSVSGSEGVSSKAAAVLNFTSAVTASNSVLTVTASDDNTQATTEETAALTSDLPATSIYIGSVDHPYFAALHIKGTSNVNFEVSFDDVVCSGGIFRAEVVITACSCINREGPPDPFSSYYVTVGHKKFANANVTLAYEVETVKFHPSCKKYDNGLWRGNIAMVMIPKPGIWFNKAVQPMSIPQVGMWESSDILQQMSSQRRHCRVIGWSSKAPLIDTAIARLIPLKECANPVCQEHLPCPIRTTRDGFMVEIEPSEPSLLPGALLICSKRVFAIVNTMRECTTNKVFAACSPEELLYAKYNFKLSREAQQEFANYNNTFKKSIIGWDREMGRTPPTSKAVQYHASQEASWIYTLILVAGYHSFVSF